MVFESGAVRPDGSIEGNDNDTDAAAFEPHYTEIRSRDQVQIYESIMVDANGALTTGLLTAVRYVKDNRLLPHGFDKQTADKDIAVLGDAADDANFTGAGDRVRYSVAVERSGSVRGGGGASVSADRLSLGEQLEEVRRGRAAAVQRRITTRWGRRRRSGSPARRDKFGAGGCLRRPHGYFFDAAKSLYRSATTASPG